VVELKARTACDGLLPLEIGQTMLSEVDVGVITSVAPFAGQEAAVSQALQSQVGAAFPAPNRTTGRDDARLVWSGQGQAFVLGPVLAPIAGAAMTDQSDAWASVELQGPAARDVLARLVPVDLRPDAFREGHAARTLLFHMSCVLMRTGADHYGILVFRSMAGTLVHDLKTAMEGVAARG
jgi:sarcosine oxidase subunit gamma